MKHWTEPNGIFILNIPIEWKAKNSINQDGENGSPYCFELYNEPVGCFQISCYPLDEKKINPNLPLQNNNSEIEWTFTQQDDEKFITLLFGAQIDDHLCFAKYIYSKRDESKKKIFDELEKVNTVLKTFRLIPKEDRHCACDLDKYDNFLMSLCASYDLLYNAIESESFIEILVVSANQIDAFLRLSIILFKQISKTTFHTEVFHNRVRQLNKIFKKQSIGCFFGVL